MLGSDLRVEDNLGLLLCRIIVVQPSMMILSTSPVLEYLVLIYIAKIYC